MLEFTVTGQLIERTDSNVILSDTINYLTAEYTFSSDWAGLTKVAKFQLGSDDPYEITLTDDATLEGDGLNLTAGAWICTVVGYTIEGETITKQITATMPYPLIVRGSTIEDGEPFPSVTLSVAQEVLAAIATAMLKSTYDPESVGADVFNMDNMAQGDTNKYLSADEHAKATAVASTSANGLSPQATAPAAGLRNVLAVENGETAHSDKALFDATDPSTQVLGDSAVVGTAMTAARRDHKHAMPSAEEVLSDIGAASNPVLAAVAEARNVLINWHFANPVDQRGGSPYATDDYTIDMWDSENADLTVTVGASSMSLASSASADRWYQQIENFADYDGLKFTLVANIGGTLYSGTGEYDESTSEDVISIDLGSGNYLKLVSVTGSGMYVGFSVASGQTISDIRWCMCLTGEYPAAVIAALTNIAPPNHGDELAKCQRYLWQGNPYHSGSLYGSSGYAMAFNVSFPTTMRESPTMSIITAPTYNNCTYESIQKTVNGFTLKVSVTSIGNYSATLGVYRASAEFAHLL